MNNDEGIATFAANVESAARGLEPAGSWEDLRKQVPSVLNEAVSAIRAGLTGLDLWDVLEFLRRITSPGDLGHFRESLNTSLPACVEVVALIGLAQDSTAGQSTSRKPSEEDGSSLAQLAEAAERIVQLAQLVAISSSADTHLGRTAELTGLLRTFEVSVRGRNYVSLSRDIVGKIFSPVPIRDLAVKHAGFSPEDVYRLSDAIQLHRQGKYEADFEKFEKIVEATADGQELTEDEAAEGRALFAALFTEPGQGLAFTSAELSMHSGMKDSTVAEILNCFSSGTISESAYGACEKFVYGENLLSGKGMLRRGDCYLAIGDPLPHDYVRPVIEARLKKQSKAWNQYQRHRDRWVETSAGDMLAQLLGISSPSVRSLKYRAPDPAADSCDLSQGSVDPFVNSLETEADALIVIDDVAICVEVKAGSITDKARSGNVKRVETDLEKTVGEAAHQASRLETLITEHRGLWNPNGKWMDLSGVQEVHTVVVCLDDWGPLAIATDALVRAGVLKSESIPWLVSLHDLSVISSILTSPASFLTYLRRRTDPATSRLLMASDELDVVMWYIQGGLYFEPDPDLVHKRYPLTKPATKGDRKRFEKSNIPTQVGTHADPLDAWMYYCEGQTSIPAERPERTQIAEVEQLVDSLCQLKVRGWLRTGADLAAASQESQEFLAEHRQRLVDLTIQDGRFHTSLQTYASAWGHVGFFMGTQPPLRSIEQCAERLRNYMRLKSHQLQLDRAMGVLIDTAGEVVWADYANEGHVPDAALDREVAASGLLPPAQMRAQTRKPPPARPKKPTKRKRR